MFVLAILYQRYRIDLSAEDKIRKCFIHQNNAQFKKEKSPENLLEIEIEIALAFIVGSL